MPLDKQVVGVNFTKGLETHTDKRITIPGTMIALRNVTLSENETFQRRNGTGAILSGTAISGLSLRSDELLILDGTTLKSLAPAVSATAYTVGTMTNLTLSKDEIVRGTGLQDSYDCATSGGLTCYVWRDKTAGGTLNGLKVTVRDESSGTVVMAPTFLKSTGTTYNPHVVAVTGAFIIFYVENSGPPGTLYARVIQTSAPDTLGTETSLRTDIDGTIVGFDVCASGASAFVYYTSSDATYSTRAIAVTRSGATPSVSAGPLDVTTAAAVPALNIAAVTICAYSASLLGVFLVTNAAAATPGMWAGVITTAMAVSVAAAVKDATAAVLNVCNLTAVLNSTTIYVYSDDYGRKGEATATARLVRRTGLNSANAITSAATTWVNSMTRPDGTNGPFIAAKAFLSGSTVYVPMGMVETGTGSLQNTWLLLDDTARVVARALIGSYGPPNGTINSLAATVTLSSGALGLPVGERTLLSAAANLTGVGATTINVSATGMARFRFVLATSVPLMTNEVGPLAYYGNAVLSVFGGSAATEAAFYFYPEVVTAAQGAAGNVPDGAHGIVALYEWVDEQGQRHQSAPSVAITLTVAAGPKTCTIAVPTLSLTQKTAVNVVAYATKAGGATYFRVNSLSSPTANSTTAPTVTITYNLTDAQLEVGEVLYTTGGTLPNNGPPPCSVLAVHQNRAFINVSDDPYAFQYSQPWVSGFGVQWNETLRGRVESTGGPISGFASIDDKLIIFRPRKFGVLFGQGPTTSGAQNGYQVIDQPTDVGCTEPRSILVTPQGVIFKSTSKGWYILGRDLQLHWIGGGVEDWDSQGVTSAVLLDTIHECRFTTNDASGLTLVYDYTSGQWSTFSSFTGVDAAWWSGGNAYVRATTTSIIKELPATSAGYAYGDGATSTAGTTPTNAPTPFTGSTVPMVFQTGWLKPGEALQAFQRIWRVLLTGAAAGYPAPQTTISQNILAGVTTIPVVSTAAFANDGLDSVTMGLGTARYETTSDGGSITNATTFELATATAQDHNIGDTFRGIPVLGAAGTLQIDFYFDGDDSAAYQTITISDVADLVNGNAWDVRLQPNLQKCDAIMMKVTSTPASNDPGASLNFSGMTLELGVKKGARKYPAAQTK